VSIELAQQSRESRNDIEFFGCDGRAVKHRRRTPPTTINSSPAPASRRRKKRWDAGEIGCGQLVFELHRRMKQMKPGESLELIACDPGTPTDLPAWCRMTGHALIAADHRVYVIRRRAD
jgi:tRNA 2-thiouridine synthesizing protein A